MSFFQKGQVLTLNGLEYSLDHVLHERSVGRNSSVSEVWKATQGTAEDSADFVVKLSEEIEGEDQDYLLRERNAYSRLSGESFAISYGSGIYVRDRIKYHYLILDFVEGPTLFDLILSESKANGSILPYERALSTAIQLAKIFSLIELKGLTYLDIKPENIIVGKEKLVVCDLESCCEIGLTLDDLKKIGTPLYYSPEIAKALLNLRGIRMDTVISIFSFGILFFELLVQKEPFKGESIEETSSNIINKKTPLHLLSQRGISQAIIDIIDKCLQKDPENRFQSFQEVVNAFEAI